MINSPDGAATAPNSTAKKRRRTSLSKEDLLAGCASLINPEFLEPSEAFAILFGRIETARRSLKRALLRQAQWRTGILALAAQNFDGAEPPVPTSTLSRLNSSRVVPDLVRENAALTTTQFGEVARAVVEGFHRNEAPHCLVDMVTVTTGMSGLMAAAVVHRVTGEQVVDPMLSATIASRRFWMLLAQARARFAVLRVQGLVPTFGGDLGYVTDRELAELLPGSLLPDHVQRQEFVIRFTRAHGRSYLDLYSATGIPLARHWFVTPALLFHH